MKKILISILALGCMACLKPNSRIMNVSGVKKANADDESSEDFYEEEDYMYDDFLDEVFNDASMTSDDEKISMRTTHQSLIKIWIAFMMRLDYLSWGIQ